VCDPALAKCADAADTPPKQSRASSQTKVPENDFDNWTDIEHGLHESLCIWRDQAAEARWGQYHIAGGIGIISTDQIDRIVSLARIHRISSLSDLERELKWLYFTQYGPEIVRIIHATYPPLLPQVPVLKPEPEPSMAALGTTSSQKKPPRQVTCSGCNKRGHTCESEVCIIIYNALLTVYRSDLPQEIRKAGDVQRLGRWQVNRYTLATIQSTTTAVTSSRHYCFVLPVLHLITRS
jgi:hypothetical protein